jgi:uncharacterized protein YjbI with pentapeptide repeats
VTLKRGAYLSRAYLHNTDLSRADGTPYEELEQQDLSLEGPTCPTARSTKTGARARPQRRMGRVNEPRSMGSRTARGIRKTGLLWEGEDSEGTRLDDYSDCSTEARWSAYHRWVISFYAKWMMSSQRVCALISA